VALQQKFRRLQTPIEVWIVGKEVHVKTPWPLSGGDQSDVNSFILNQPGFNMWRDPTPVFEDEGKPRPVKAPVDDVDSLLLQMEEEMGLDGTRFDPPPDGRPKAIVDAENEMRPLVLGVRCSVLPNDPGKLRISHPFALSDEAKKQIPKIAGNHGFRRVWWGNADAGNTNTTATGGGQPLAPRYWNGTDFYATLKIKSTATRDEVKRAFRKLAAENHPDTHKDDPKAMERFKEISEAYKVLWDPDKRRLYDMGANPFKDQTP
jgi:DnaJ-domain-containing protein 1